METLQKFQTFAAAIVAFCAAVVAYFSAVHVSHKNARAMREKTERDISHALAKEEEVNVKRQLAFLTMFNARLLQALLSIRLKLNLLNGFRQHSHKRADGLSYDASGSALIWAPVANMEYVRAESGLIYINWEDLTALRADHQAAFHVTNIHIDACDRYIESFRKSAEIHSFIPAAEIDGAIDVLADIQNELEAVQRNLFEDIQNRMREAAQAEQRVRIMPPRRRWFNFLRRTA